VLTQLGATISIKDGFIILSGKKINLCKRNEVNMIRGGKFFENVSTVTQGMNLEDVLLKHRNTFSDEISLGTSKFEPLKFLQ
jgi:uncharacterized pyridoxamine 5'-phosphate oxidase family protein